MTSKNDITGDKLATKPSSEAYRDNWDRIFGARKLTSILISVVHRLGGETVEVPEETKRLLLKVSLKDDEETE